jgi:hypothetical protein
LHPPNADLIASRLAPHDAVLDIGGWARPFNRANYVMDQEPYATRGYYGLPAQGGEREHFTRDTWIERDICAHQPYPFADKELDFVICSHTLEDVRDPLWVCAEIVRIGKAGYLEVPSRLAESCRGVEPGQVGWSHHRWLIDIAPGEVRFMMKYHKIHSHWRLSFPRRFLRGLAAEEQTQWLFWSDRFDFSETILHGPDNIAAELAAFVARVRPYPRPLVAADRLARTAAWYGRRAWDRLGGSR